VQGLDDAQCKEGIASVWEARKKVAAERGTAMHKDLQFICEGKPPPQGETKEVALFRAWYDDFCHKYNLAPWRAEWVVYYEHNGEIIVAGQVDLVMKHREREEYWCIDYKRKDPAPKYKGGPKQLLGTEVIREDDEMGTGPFAELPANDFSKYTAQLNAYGHIAATQYGIDFRDHMYVLQIFPSLSKAHIMGVERLDAEMQQVFELEARRASTALPELV